MPIFLPAAAGRASAVAEVEFDSKADAKKAGFDTRVVEIEYQRCPHCRRDYKISRGSGTRRGFCTACGSPHCGGPSCWSCPRARKLFGRGAGRRRRRALSL